MNYTKLYSVLCFAFLLYSIIFFACRKVEDSDPQPGPGINSGDADEIAARLLFLRSSKQQGNTPAASANNTLKISFKDTLYLTDEVFKPIKFLHDKTTNVTGALIQVLMGGSASSFYYDVPELKQMSQSDSVSVIFIGIDPSNLNPPIQGEIKIIPYDVNKKPITQIVKPLMIVKNEVNSTANNGCGLELPALQQWDWVCSFVIATNPVDTFRFYNEPKKVHSPEGQVITGACCNGQSRYPLRCPGDTAGIFDRKLHFATFYRIDFEIFKFFTNGDFSRKTNEESPVPLPSQSDFCGSGPGVILKSDRITSYEGKWAITPAQIPANAPGWLKLDKEQLTLQTLSTSGGGFGNPGGVIHQLDCKIGALVLVQVDRGGGSMHLIKVYFRRTIGENGWYE